MLHNILILVAIGATVLASVGPSALNRHFNPGIATREDALMSLRNVRAQSGDVVMLFALFASILILGGSMIVRSTVVAFLITMAMAALTRVLVIADLWIVAPTAAIVCFLYCWDVSDILGLYKEALNPDNSPDNTGDEL